MRESPPQSPLEPVRLELADGLAVLRLARGKANALDIELCRALTARLGELGDSDARALILTGEGEMFSAGVDLPRLAAGGAPYVEEFLPALSDAFMALFSFPRPVVAALNGHAIAGGAVLAAACDRRVMNVERGRIGVTELLVGVPFPIGALEILRCAYGTARLRELALLGRTFPAEEALALGLVDEAAVGERVVARATEVAVELAAIPADSFTHVKRLLQAPYRQRIARDGAADDEAVTRLWTSPTTLAALEHYSRRVLGR